MKFDYVGYNRYYYPTTGGGCKASFISQTLLDEARSIFPSTSLTKPGGWKETELREWMNTKLFSGVSTIWKQIISQVSINSIQNTNTGSANVALREITTQSDNYFYLPSLKEVVINPSYDDIFKKELGNSNQGTYPIFGDDTEKGGTIIK